MKLDIIRYEDGLTRLITSIDPKDIGRVDGIEGVDGVSVGFTIFFKYQIDKLNVTIMDYTRSLEEREKVIDRLKNRRMEIIKAWEES